MDTYTQKRLTQIQKLLQNLKNGAKYEVKSKIKFYNEYPEKWELVNGFAPKTFEYYIVSFENESISEKMIENVPLFCSSKSDDEYEYTEENREDAIEVICDLIRGIEEDARFEEEEKEALHSE